MSKCAKLVDPSRRGHTVGLWWQILSVAFQKERNRVLYHKAIASLKHESPDVDDLSVTDMFDCLPCLTE